MFLEDKFLIKIFRKENLIILLVIIVIIQLFIVQQRQRKDLEPILRYTMSNSEEIQKLKAEISDLKETIKAIEKE